jgi:hypothetical protein
LRLEPDGGSDSGMTETARGYVSRWHVDVGSVLIAFNFLVERIGFDTGHGLEIEIADRVKPQQVPPQTEREACAGQLKDEENEKTSILEWTVREARMTSWIL